MIYSSLAKHASSHGRYKNMKQPEQPYNLNQHIYDATNEHGDFIGRAFVVKFPDQSTALVTAHHIAFNEKRGNEPERLTFVNRRGHTLPTPKHAVFHEVPNHDIAYLPLRSHAGLPIAQTVDPEETLTLPASLTHPDPRTHKDHHFRVSSLLTESTIVKPKEPVSLAGSKEVRIRKTSQEAALIRGMSGTPVIGKGVVGIFVSAISEEGSLGISVSADLIQKRSR